MPSSRCRSPERDRGGKTWVGPELIQRLTQAFCHKIIYYLRTGSEKGDSP
jgi:hypothetical protein